MSAPVTANRTTWGSLLSRDPGAEVPQRGLFGTVLAACVELREDRIFLQVNHSHEIVMAFLDGDDAPFWQAEEK